MISRRFPSAVPEIPVVDVDQASRYYKQHLGFDIDWTDDAGIGILGVSKGNCRLFLTDTRFRSVYGNSGPVVIWVNLASIDEVNALHSAWHDQGARIVSSPESKPWKLHEFTAMDLDGNLIRVFHDFGRAVDTQPEPGTMGR
jgi:predicted lactoylglutathione lyase